MSGFDLHADAPPLLRPGSAHLPRLQISIRIWIPPGGMDILETIAGHGARLGRPLPHPRGSRATPAHFTNTEDVTTACALIFDSAMEAQVRHVGQPQLTASLNSARKRSIGDRWAWNRKSADSDITPIVAATLALWGLNSTKVMRRTGERRKGVVWSW